MKLVLLVGVLMGCSTLVNANNDSIVKDSTAMRQFTKKNEVYLNISPALIPMLGGASDLISYAIKYKRRDKSLNHALRIGFSAIKTTDPVSYKQNTYQHDSTMILQKTSAAYSSNIWVNIGWEWIQHYKRFERFYGADLILGYYQSKNSIHQDVYSKINNLYNQSYYENIDYRYTSKRMGLSPFFGLKYHLSQHFIVAMQAGVDITYNFNRASNTKNFDSQYSGFDFKLGTPAFINDISFVYNF